MTRHFAALPLVLAACGRPESLDVGPYRAIDLQTDARAVFLGPDHPDGLAPGVIELRCPGSTRLTPAVRPDGTLVIKGDGRSCSLTATTTGTDTLRASGHSRVDVVGGWDGLATVDVTGGAIVTADTITSDALEIRARGGAAVYLDGLDVGALDVDLAGRSDTTLLGVARTANVVLTGTAALHARDLDITDATVAASGSATCELSVLGTIAATTEGRATIDLWGGATVLDDAPSGLTVH